MTPHRPADSARKAPPSGGNEHRRPESGTDAREGPGKRPGGPLGLSLALPKPPRAPRAPGHLTKPMQAWWRDVMRVYELEPHHVLVLTAAAEAHDQMTKAREILAVEGMTFEDRFKQLRPRPEVQVEHNATIRFARLLREL